MDKEMSKYGVDERLTTKAQEKLEKLASSGCPVDGCGKAPERHGNILLCPTHGSEPFEVGNAEEENS